MGSTQSLIEALVSHGSNNFLRLMIKWREIAGTRNATLFFPMHIEPNGLLLIAVPNNMVKAHATPAAPKLLEKIIAAVPEARINALRFMVKPQLFRKRKSTPKSTYRISLPDEDLAAAKARFLARGFSETLAHHCATLEVACAVRKRSAT